MVGKDYMIQRMMYACHWVTHNDTDANLTKTFGTFVYENRKLEMNHADWSEPLNRNKCAIEAFANWVSAGCRFPETLMAVEDRCEMMHGCIGYLHKAISIAHDSFYSTIYGSPYIIQTNISYYVPTTEAILVAVTHGEHSDMPTTCRLRKVSWLP